MNFLWSKLNNLHLVASCQGGGQTDKQTHIQMDIATTRLKRHKETPSMKYLQFNPSNNTESLGTYRYNRYWKLSINRVNHKKKSITNLFFYKDNLCFVFLYFPSFCQSCFCIFILISLFPPLAASPVFVFVFVFLYFPSCCQSCFCRSVARAVAASQHHTATLPTHKLDQFGHITSRSRSPGL